MNLLLIPEIKKLFKILEKESIEARLVGGCVRDSLLGIESEDIDIAVNMPPQETLNALEKAGVKVIPTGIAHGTITAIINKTSFQLTSLRQDIQTFGRHAKVIFGTDWLEDAKRRDFTINALYLDKSGNLYDPFEGRQDLEKGAIKFIGTPAQRIQEDFLRILRYYRFLAYYGKGTPEPIRELSKLKEGLVNLSKERVQHELFKLLEAKDPRVSLRLMEKDGIFETLFNTHPSMEKLFRLVEFELALNLKPHALRRLYTLFEDKKNFYKTFFRLSNDQSLYLERIRKILDMKDRRLTFYEYGAVSFLESVMIIQSQTLLPLSEKVRNYHQQQEWVTSLEKPIFPLTGQDLLEAGFSKGKEIGKALKTCKLWWIEKDFEPDKQQCLDYCLTLNKVFG